MRTLIQAREEETFIWAKFRNDDGTSYEKIPFLNYFYISNNDVAHIPQKCHQYIGDIIGDDVFEGYSTLYLLNNNERGLLRWNLENEGIVCYEADINAVKRFLITNPKYPSGS